MGPVAASRSVMRSSSVSHEPDSFDKIISTNNGYLAKVTPGAGNG